MPSQSTRLSALFLQQQLDAASSDDERARVRQEIARAKSSASYRQELADRYTQQEVTPAGGLSQDVSPRQEVPRGTLGSIMKGLRTLQQYTTLGPALAIQESVQEGTPLTLGAIARSGREASRDDLSFRDLAERGGLEGWKATALGLGGDLVLDPLNFIAPVKVASMAGRAARLPQAAKAVGLDRAVAAAKDTALAKSLGKHFVTDYGKPQVFIDRQDDYVRGLGRRQEETAELAKKLSGFSPEDQRVMKEWLEAPYAGEPISQFHRTLYGGGRPGVTPAIRDKILEGASEGLKTTTRRGDNILDVSREVRDAGIKQYREGIEAKIFQDPNKPKIKKGKIPKSRGDLEGRYVHRLWKEIEEINEKAGRPTTLASLLDNVKSGSQPRITPAMTGVTKRRKDVGEVDLTQVREIGPGFVKGHALTGRLIETKKFFKNIADQDFVEAPPSSLVSKKGKVKSPAKLAEYEKKRGLKRVGDSKIYGPLKGKMVPEAVYEDIVGAVGEQGPGKWGRKWQQGVGWWKYGKIVLNPATHSRNITGNLILAHMAGLAPWKLNRYAQSARSLAKEDEFYKLAKQHGTFLTDTFVGSEVPHIMETAKEFGQFQKGVEGWLGTVKGKLGSAARKIGKFPATAYQKEEQFFKQAFFIDQMKKSMSKAGKRSLDALSDEQKKSFARAAAKAADDALFNYRKLPRIVDKIRRWGVVPFIAFPTKAASATVKMLGNRPGVLNQYGNMIRAFEPSLQEQAIERSALPEYMQENWMRLPPNTPFVESENGEPLFMNMEYILPWAELGDMGERLRTGDWKQGFLGTGGQEPAFLNIPALKLAASVYSGEDAFTGRAIEDYPGGAAMYYFDQIMPPLLGRQGRELVSSFQGEGVDPRRPYMQKRSPGAAVASNIFGLRATPRDITEARVRKYRSLAYQMDEKRREASSIRRRGATTPREIRVMESDLRKNMDELREIFAKIYELQHGRPPGDGGGAE
jgi:hypothetical protein